MSAFTEAYRKLFPPPLARDVCGLKPRETYKPCCDDFEFAHKGDGDVGPAIYDFENKWHFMADGYVMKYCPFCGRPLPPPPGDQT